MQLCMLPLKLKVKPTFFPNLRPTLLRALYTVVFNTPGAAENIVYVAAKDDPDAIENAWTYESIGFKPRDDKKEDGSGGSFVWLGLNSQEVFTSGQPNLFL